MGGAGGDDSPLGDLIDWAPRWSPVAHIPEQVEVGLSLLVPGAAASPDLSPLNVPEARHSASG